MHKDTFKMFLAIVLISLFLTGCATLPKDRYGSFSFACIGQAVDFGSSAVILQDDNFKEGNRVLNLGDTDTTIVVMAIAKTTLLTLDWYYGDKQIDWVIGGVGLAAGTWNIGLKIAY
jgi:hypothetical protein